MRFIFYIFILSQLFNLLDVLAETIKKKPSETEIKWEKVEDKKSNNFKKIIWEYYEDDESYLKNINTNNKDKNSDDILSNTKNDENKFINQKKINKIY